MRTHIHVFLVAMAIACSHGCFAGELRGVWADSWGAGFKTPEQTIQLVEFAKRYGFTDVFVQVRKRGDAYYASSIEPRAIDSQEGYDPLADLLKQAHKQGIRVHAWVMLYDLWTDSPKLQLPPGHPYARHPDWVTEDANGAKTYVNGRMYLDPGLPKVRDYLRQVVLDIASKYPVDGIHLDGLRYPDARFGYNPKSVALFNAERHREGTPTPDDLEWSAWRREQVTQFARELTQAIHKARPSTKVSLAAYWNQQEARDRFFQDWPAWAKAGYFDFIVPMVFVPKSVPEFIKMVDDELAAGGGTPIYIGQGAWRFPLETTMRHLRVIRGKGAAGFVLFDYTALSTPNEDGKCLADQLKLSP